MKPFRPKGWKGDGQPAENEVMAEWRHRDRRYRAYCSRWGHWTVEVTTLVDKVEHSQIFDIPGPVGEAIVAMGGLVKADKDA